jgi:hypothetical protein
MKPQYQAILDAMPTRSAWARGVRDYAADLLQTLEENGVSVPTQEEMLNGADTWRDWADGGCGLVYDVDIAERLCTATELRKTRGGELPPNSRESWLDCEARAVYQAAAFILRYVRSNPQTFEVTP